MMQSIFQDILTTLCEAFLGLFLGLFFALIFFWISYMNTFVKKVIYPIILISQTLPIIVIAPFVVIALGYGILPKVFIVSINCFFPIFLSLSNGTKSIDNDKVNLMRTMNASKNQILRYIYMPFLKTYFYAGLKISVTYSIMSAVIAEWLGGENGLGVRMIRAKKSYNPKELFISSIIVCLLTLTLVSIVTIIERYFKIKYLLILFLPFILLPFCGLIKKEEKTHINIVLDYIPNTNHTGIYVAEKMGFFRDENLEVDIKYPPQDGAVSLVASNKAEFGIDFQDQLVPFLENENLCNKIKVIASIIQHNTAVILSKNESKISSLCDFKEKKFAVSTNPMEQKLIKFLFKKNNVNFIFTNETDCLATLNNGIDAVLAFYGWDFIASEIKNINVNSFFLRDLNPALDFYTPVLIVNAEYEKTHPDVVSKFVYALKKGYTYTSLNPIESAKLFCNAVPHYDYNFILASQKFISQEYINDANSWGIIDQERWNRFYKWLYQNKLTDSKIHNKDVVLYDYMQ